MQINVVDTGTGFGPAGDSHELAAGRRSGGLGMRLIKGLMAEVHFEVIPGQKNELRMVKKLKKK